MDRDEFLHKLQDNAAEDISLVENKNQDYAKEIGPFYNFEMTAEGKGETVEQTIMTFLWTKMTRLQNCLDKGEHAVEDERIEDTLRDIRNYSNIMQVWYENDFERFKHDEQE